MSDMKIGVITILKVNNYGAELQAYATQAVLRSLGHDAEIIDYLFYKNPGHKATRKSKYLFKAGVKKKLAEMLYPIISRLKERDRAAQDRRRHSFDEFHKRYTAMSPTYRTIADLYNNHRDYDVYMTGSDQVWNPGIYSSLLPYFLDFAPEERKRIAYAASFGVTTLPSETKPVYQRYLQQYTAIGVREKDGLSILDDLGVKATNVIDPTLLLKKDEWATVAVKPDGLPEKYVLVYELTPCQYLSAVAQNVASRLSVPIVRLCRTASVEDKDVINITDAGPSEFIHLFMHAAFVVTNSFHGTAFAVNFETPFYVVTPVRKNNNGRQRNLLSLLGLSDRLIEEGKPMPEQVEIDFTDASKRLETERSRSLNFLISAIDGSKA